MVRRSRDPGREYVPPVAKVRLRYAKRGRLRFSSHRDFQRALERALRRAQIPMAYSAGFRPHPKISYANSSPTGVASEAEYVEIGIAAQISPETIKERLDAALPDGLDIVEAVAAGSGDMVARLQASKWLLEFQGVSEQELSNAVKLMMESGPVEVERVTKSGPKQLDVTAAVQWADITFSPEPASGCAILTVVVTHGTPSVRPDDVLAALRKVADLVPPVPVRMTRLAQGQLDVEARTISDPLAPDRAEANHESVDALE